MFDRDSFLQIASDQFKDAYGFRPGFAIRDAWQKMPDEELMKEAESLNDAIIASIKRERDEQAAALRAWRKKLKNYIALGAKTMADAIRWDIQSQEIENDIKWYGYGYYCHLHGIPYKTEHMIKRIMEN